MQQIRTIKAALARSCAGIRQDYSLSGGCLLIAAFGLFADQYRQLKSRRRLNDTDQYFRCQECNLPVMAYPQYKLMFVLGLLTLALPVCCAGAASAQEPTKSATKAAKASGSGANAQTTAPRDANSVPSDLDGAAKLLAAGKTEPAIARLSGIIATGNLPATVMARALYLRGAAYRQQSKPAMAISDLTSALWLKGGLSDVDRADATQQRAAAYGEAGLTEQGQAIAAGSANAKPMPAASSGGGLFSGFFGTAAAPAAKPAIEPTKAAKPVSPTPVRASSPPPSAPTIALAQVTPHAAAGGSPKASLAGGVFHSRVALVRTRAEAETVVGKLKAQYSIVLSGHNPEIEEAAFGNMGSYFQVRVGPFATAPEAAGVCGKLKGGGFDCIPVSR